MDAKALILWDDPELRQMQAALEEARLAFLRPVAHLPLSKQAAAVAALRVVWTLEMHLLDRMRSGPRAGPK